MNLNNYFETEEIDLKQKYSRWKKVLNLKKKIFEIGKDLKQNYFETEKEFWTKKSLKLKKKDMK